ncbi:MAG: Threonine dehydratase, catabolic @ L-serine dehydratase, (PLP)-dependent, partial [uncultured Chloroflexia bacterium]
EDIRLAHQRLRGVAVHTPLVLCPHSGTERLLYFKPESFQPVGSFKLRGAYNKIASLSEEEKGHGVIAYSSGNHAQGVAYAARKLGVRATIVMPGDASKVKLERTAALGAEIVQVGAGGEERRARAEELATEHGYALVPPYNDEALIAGQGTIGLEILEDLPDVDAVLVPVGGGGLISGISTALKLSRPEVRVIGVEPELVADARASLRSGRIVELPPEQAGRTIADGLRAQHLGEITFAHIRRFVDDIVTVSEDEIREAVRRLAFGARLVTEPSGAVAFAGYLFRQNELPSARLNVAVISGGSVEPLLLAEILTESENK